MAIIFTVAGVVITLGLWAFISSQTPYSPAFSHVKSGDAAAIVDQLRQLTIPYQLNAETDGTTTILVPSSLADEARIRVAGANVVQGGSIGYEIFNQPTFGLSDFVQQVDYQRAQEGELSRSIAQLDSVESARVHLAIPQQSLFVSQQRDPSAAVMIALKPGRTLDKAQANAIVNLVVGAVSGMKASQVVLLDTQGQLLHQSTESASTTASADPSAVSDQYAAQRTMERDLEQRLQDLLDGVVGAGHSRVQVSLVLDWTQGDLTSQTFLPGGQQPALQTNHVISDTEGLNNAAATVGGAAGVTSNVPTYQQQALSTTVSGSRPVTDTATTHVDSNQTYQLSSTTERTQKTPGTVQRVSVAIALDSNVATGDVPSTVEKMVQAAVGYDGKRGDTVSVVTVPMAQQPNPNQLTPVANRSTSPTGDLLSLAPFGAGAVVLLIVIAFFLLRRRRPAPVVLTAPQLVGPQTSGEAQLAPMETLPVLGESRHAQIRERLTALAEQHPAVVAAALQAWLAEDED
jgi:flagellar M-ring protein FliF